MDVVHIDGLPRFDSGCEPVGKNGYSIHSWTASIVKGGALWEEGTCWHAADECRGCLHEMRARIVLAKGGPGSGRTCEGDRQEHGYGLWDDSCQGPVREGERALVLINSMLPSVGSKAMANQTTGTSGFCGTCGMPCDGRDQFCGACGSRLGRGATIRVALGGKALASGTRIGRRYVLKEELGKGDFGTVYRARDEERNHDVAIKVFPLPQDIGRRRALERRVAEVAKLRHAGIVRVLDSRISEGSFCLVMELAGANNLARTLRDQGMLPLPTAVGILSQLLDALVFAHGNGVIHGRLSASSLLVTDRFSIEITGFVTMPAASSLPLGEPAFLAPETLVGAAASEVSDLYSAATIGYLLLTGRLPFTMAMPGLRDEILKRPVPNPVAFQPSMPQGLSEWLLRGLRKDASSRFQSAGEMRDRLERLETELVEWEHLRIEKTLRLDDEVEAALPAQRGPVDFPLEVTTPLSNATLPPEDPALAPPAPAGREGPQEERLPSLNKTVYAALALLVLYLLLLLFAFAAGYLLRCYGRTQAVGGGVTENAAFLEPGKVAASPRERDLSDAGAIQPDWRMFARSSKAAAASAGRSSRRFSRQLWMSRAKARGISGRSSMMGRGRQDGSGTFFVRS